jgi:DNA-binding NtrC family response regulator
MMSSLFRVLVVDDEPQILQLLEGRLKRKGYDVETASSGDDALNRLKTFDAHAVVTDLRMPGMDGLSLVSKTKRPTLLITGHGDKESAIKAVESGAFGFFEKPFDLDSLEVMIRRACEKHLLDQEKEALLERLDRLVKLQGREIESLDSKSSPPKEFQGSISRSPKMSEVHTTIERLAQKPSANLLILGETGTGKEVIARALHAATHVSEKGSRTPFLALNCAALPPDLLESELFGHEKGSFSGALATRIGLAEAVREGTLFLDEIGELDPRHQAKILRLLQERSFRRVGANQEQSFSGRIVAATHRDLPTLSREGKFREDLWYRLSVVTLVLPPLRERPEDFPLLIDALCRRHGLKGVAPELTPQIQTYPWPGNIRELNNWIERASILGLHTPEGLITSSPAPAGSQTSNTNSNSPESNTQDLKNSRAQVLDDHDRRWIERALEKHDGNVSAAAKDLGIDRKNLSRRMKELGLEVSKKAA